VRLQPLTPRLSGRSNAPALPSFVVVVVGGGDVGGGGGGGGYCRQLGGGGGEWGWQRGRREADRPNAVGREAGARGSGGARPLRSQAP
jgi:hypothetical protein